MFGLYVGFYLYGHPAIVKALIGRSCEVIDHPLSLFIPTALFNPPPFARLVLALFPSRLPHSVMFFAHSLLIASAIGSALAQIRFVHPPSIA